MRTFFWFMLLLAGSLLVAAAATYPAWWLVSLLSTQPVHRVMHRVAMLIALFGLILMTRRLGLADRASLGYGLPRAQFLRQLALGWLCGLALMLPLVGLLLGFGVRELRADHAYQLGPLFRLIPAGILSGLVIACIEESFFRGVLFTAVTRTSGATAAVLAPSFLYAALHFLGGKLHVPADEVTYRHGFIVLARLFERYAEPFALLDSFLALFMLGVLLALIRVRTGAIAAGIGLHAAGVATIAVVRATTTANPQDAQAALVGNYDGVIGWAAFLWFTVLVLLLLWRQRLRYWR